MYKQSECESNQIKNSIKYVNQMIKLKLNVILFNVIVTQKLRRKKYQTGKQSQWIRLAFEYGK